jgi:hypothetical protein
MVATKVRMLSGEQLLNTEEIMEESSLKNAVTHLSKEITTLQRRVSLIEQKIDIPTYEMQNALSPVVADRAFLSCACKCSAIRHPFHFIQSHPFMSFFLILLGLIVLTGILYKTEIL